MSKNNVVLKDIRKTYTLELPSFKGSEVELYENFLFGESIELERNKDEIERGVKSMILLIKRWNFTDEEGKELEVNEENLRKLPSSDLVMLLNKVTEIFKKQEKDQKKS